LNDHATIERSLSDSLARNKESAILPDKQWLYARPGPLAFEYKPGKYFVENAEKTLCFL
jgi:hypothetical protein